MRQHMKNRRNNPSHTPKNNNKHQSVDCSSDFDGVVENNKNCRVFSKEYNGKSIPKCWGRNIRISQSKSAPRGDARETVMG